MPWAGASSLHVPGSPLRHGIGAPPQGIERALLKRRGGQPCPMFRRFWFAKPLAIVPDERAYPH
jgi:hypothetical protein